jgi:SpoIIAA-like
MPVELNEIQDGPELDIQLTGKLVKSDYEQFVPAVERLVKQHGKIRMLVGMRDFHGWTAGAMWEDTKFATRHFSHIERLAVVGEKKWHQWMAGFCKPFTRAEVRYFDQAETENARAWLKAGAQGAESPGSGGPGASGRTEAS